MNPYNGDYLKPTFLLDCDSPSIRQKAEELTEAFKDTAEKAKSLFYFVRDGIKYNPYTDKATYESYRSSYILARREGYCVQKAGLLCSLARAAGIPSRLGFANIRNHIVPEKLASLLKTDLFAYHGYSELFIDGRWLKATPAFDIKMCREHRIIPVDFDGRNDAVFHRFNQDGRLHIEYLEDLGRSDDIPVEKILQSWIEVYGTTDIRPPER